ncbi:hypothetical protein LJC56_03910 [Christensenellaceae bacterium OttesenSCG-928-K19]|nr:hypothetical protein [Christensenellaceae bacterium OttesenSCG-928-K19]
MKKTIVVIAAVAFLCVLLMGCAPIVRNVGSDLSTIQQQLDQISGDISSLKAEVDELKNSQEGGQKAEADSVQGGQAASATPDEPTAAEEGAAATQASGGDYGVADLSDRVAAMVSKMESATTQTLFEVKAEAKALEREIEAQEDAAEHDFRQGVLNRADYNAIDSELEYLEDQLDNAEDAMEFRLGYDD